LVWNREKRREYSKRHPEKDRERARRWRKKNPERVKVKNAVLAAKEKALGHPAAREWYARKREEDPEGLRQKWREQDRRWRANNPEKHAARRHRQRALKAKAPGHHTGAELLDVAKQFSGLCVYCGEVADTWDHIVALSCGGVNFCWNLVPCCKSCNSRKQRKDVWEFLLQNDFQLSDSVEAYLRSAVEKNQKVMGENSGKKFCRNPYEKVSEGALWEEAERVYKENGTITWNLLDGTKYSASTYRRRLGRVVDLLAAITQ